MKAVRIVAAGFFLLGASAATYTGISTQNFVRGASHVQGTVVAIRGGIAEIAVRSADDSVVRISQPTPPRIASGDTVNLLAKAIPGTRTDYRLNDDRTLWSPLLRWIEAALAALLVATYGEQLLTDPLSVIAFKSWKLGKRE